MKLLVINYENKYLSFDIGFGQVLVKTLHLPQKTKRKVFLYFVKYSTFNVGKLFLFWGIYDEFYNYFLLDYGAK